MGDQPKAKGRKRRRPYLIGFLLAMALGLGGFLVLEVAMGPLSTAEFCASCHEMNEVYESWKQSPHHTNASGVRVTCVSCHLPPREHYVAHVTAKAWTGTKDVWQHYLGSYDADAARQHVRRTLPSQWCVHCHGNLLGQPSSSAVAIVHQTSLDQAANTHHRCVACHDSLHGPKPEPATEAKQYPEADNSYCYVCHINFQAEEFANVHLAAGISCDRCHGISEAHMDDEEGLNAPDTMFPKAKVNASCMTAECHPKERMAQEIGHRPFLAEATPQHAHCTDCHGEHRLDERHRQWDKETRKLIWTDGVRLKPEGDGMGM
ncbi:NapC/NirT family cytochrome c [bacterium]|nr:NapC/NirT family cytochrome c [bacterium]